jgi:hypothetical protein
MVKSYKVFQQNKFVFYYVIKPWSSSEVWDYFFRFQVRFKVGEGGKFHVNIYD